MNSPIDKGYGVNYTFFRDVTERSIDVVIIVSN